MAQYVENKKKPSHLVNFSHTYVLSLKILITGHSQLPAIFCPFNRFHSLQYPNLQSLKTHAVYIDITSFQACLKIM